MNNFSETVMFLCVGECFGIQNGATLTIAVLGKYINKLSGDGV